MRSSSQFSTFSALRHSEADSSTSRRRVSQTAGVGFSAPSCAKSWCINDGSYDATNKRCQQWRKTVGLRSASVNKCQRDCDMLPWSNGIYWWLYPQYATLSVYCIGLYVRILVKTCRSSSPNCVVLCRMNCGILAVPDTLCVKSNNYEIVACVYMRDIRSWRYQDYLEKRTVHTECTNRH